MLAVHVQEVDILPVKLLFAEVAFKRFDAGVYGEMTSEICRSHESLVAVRTCVRIYALVPVFVLLQVCTARTYLVAN